MAAIHQHHPSIAAEQAAKSASSQVNLAARAAIISARQGLLLMDWLELESFKLVHSIGR